MTDKQIDFNNQQVIRIKRLAAEMIELAIFDYDLTFAKENSESKSRQVEQKRAFNRNEAIKNREESKWWFAEKSKKPFGFGWCLRISEQNGALINRRLDEIDEKLIYY